MYHSLKAKDIMTTRLVTLSPDDNIYTGVHALLSHKISGAPVVDKDGKFLGVFNEKSCMTVIIGDQYHGIANHMVNNLMFTNVKTISPETALVDIAQIFRNEPLRRLPVLDGEKLVGLVSRRDVLHAIDTNLKKQGVERKVKSVAPMPYYSALIDPLDNSDKQA